MVIHPGINTNLAEERPNLATLSVLSTNGGVTYNCKVASCQTDPYVTIPHNWKKGQGVLNFAMGIIYGNLLDWNVNKYWKWDDLKTRQDFERA